jgi:hypothetical protein
MSPTNSASQRLHTESLAINTMDLLPDEVHCAIASYLSMEDLPKYRLTSKRHADIGAEFLFEGFLCKPTSATLERMNHILTNTRTNLAQHVKTLDYDGETSEAGDRDAEDPDPRIPIFREIVERFVQAGSPISMLGALALSLELFLPENCSAAFTLACANITIFDVSFDCSELNRLWADETLRAFKRTLRAFLTSMKQLTGIGLRFDDYQSVSRRHWRGRFPFQLGDIVPLHFAWSRLRTLELCCFCVDERQLVALLGSYEGVLEIFHLCDLFMSSGNDVEDEDEDEEEDEGGVEHLEGRKRSSRGIFQQFSKMEKLKSGSIKEWVETVETNQAISKYESEWKIQVNGREIAIETNLTRWLVDE